MLRTAPRLRARRRAGVEHAAVEWDVGPEDALLAGRAGRAPNERETDHEEEGNHPISDVNPAAAQARIDF